MQAVITNLIKAIVMPLADSPELVQIQITTTPDSLIFDLHVSAKDAGLIIGKQGRVAQAIRTVVYSQNNDQNRRIKLNIIPE